MKRLFPLIAFALASTCSFAYLQGGEFRYEHLSGLTYRIELWLYTPIAGTGDLPEVPITIDGDEVLAQSGPPSDFPGGNCGGVRIRPYSAEYTFSESGPHTLCYTGYNRPSGVTNIPNSVNTEFCVTAQMIISPFIGVNRSPRFINPQSNGEWVWSTWLHDPGAVDPDGDSLSFELVAPHGNACGLVIGYLFPYGPNLVWLDPATGVFHWNYPPLIGWWNLCIRASEWRNGVLIGQVTRDMTVCVDQITNGMAENESSKPLAVFVSDDGAWLHLLGPGNEPFRVEIYDPLGALVGTHRLGASGSMVPIADLRTGAYIARVVERSGATRQARFVLQ